MMMMMTSLSLSLSLCVKLEKQKKIFLCCETLVGGERWKYRCMDRSDRYMYGKKKVLSRDDRSELESSSSRMDGETNISSLSVCSMMKG
jgi:hypothetical protein